MVKCIECGNLFSEDQKCCPICGCPVEFSKKPETPAPQQGQYSQTDSYQYSENFHDNRGFWDKVFVRGLSNNVKARKYIHLLHTLNLIFFIVGSIYALFASINTYLDYVRWDYEGSVSLLFFLLIFLGPVLCWVGYYLIELLLGYAAMFIDLSEDVHSIKDEISMAHNDIVVAIKGKSEAKEVKVD